MPRQFAFLFLLVSVTPAVGAEEVREMVDKSTRIVFLGDSITAAGQYIGYFDAYLTAQQKKDAPTIINCGLPSETVSGLSEEGHAGGAFPRPDLAERLDRVLALTKPDLVFACYGINCGIYEPFAEERLARYQQGMQRLKEKVEGAGAKLILITPPFYDDQRAPKKFSYNEVLDRYSRWLLDQRSNEWQVIDLHEPMTNAVQARRAKEKGFTFQPDGVHPNEAGHWYMAQQLILSLGDQRASKWSTPKEMVDELNAPNDLLSLAKQRVDLLRDAYVGRAGHKRPGVAKGLSLDEAHKKATELDAKIQSLVQ